MGRKNQKQSQSLETNNEKRRIEMHSLLSEQTTAGRYARMMVCHLDSFRAKSRISKKRSHSPPTKSHSLLYMIH